MKTIAWILTILALIWAPADTAAETSVQASDGPSMQAEEVVKRVKDLYAAHCCFQASFNQLSVNVAMDLKGRFTGTMYVRRPGSIALDVETPERQKVVLHGRSYSVYFPDDGNAVTGEIPPEVNVEHFFGFLANVGALERDFSVSFPPRSFSLEQGLIFVELVDTKNPSSTYRIMMGVDAERFTIRRAIIHDALGNYNRYDLSDIRFLDSLPEDRFRVETGAGPEANPRRDPAVQEHEAR